MQSRLKLTARLEAVAEMVGNDSVVADIGTDHAKLPAYLILRGRTRRAIAADLRKGPLKKAEETVNSYGVQDKVSLVLSDGLENVDLSGVTDIVIAGMGGEQIVKIISGCSCSRIKNAYLILQPMKDPELLRQYLCENGFEICSESAALDRGFAYCIIKARYTGKAIKADRLYYNVGQLCKNSDIQSLEYIKRLVSKQKKKINGLKCSHMPLDLTDEQEFLKQIERMVEEYKLSETKS